MARIKHIAARIPDGKRKSFPVGVSNNKTKTEINTNSSTDTSTNNNEKKKKIVVNVKGKRRYKSGTVAIREIRKYTKTTDHLFPDAPFARLVREIGYDFKSDIRYTSQVRLGVFFVVYNIFIEFSNYFPTNTSIFRQC
jgi:histone H3